MFQFDDGLGQEWAWLEPPFEDLHYHGVTRELDQFEARRLPHLRRAVVGPQQRCAALGVARSVRQLRRGGRRGQRARVSPGAW